MQTFSTDAVINRLKIALSINQDNELADRLGISKSTLSSWKSRNSLDLIKVLAICEQVDLNWLFRGEELSCIKEDNKLPDDNHTFVALLMEKSEEIGRLKQRIIELERNARRAPNLVSVSTPHPDVRHAEHTSYQMVEADITHAAEP